MFLPQVQLHEAASLDQASDALVRYAPHVRPLAGGTDLLVDLKTGRLRLEHLVSLNRIDSLRGVSELDGCLRIGALTTVTTLDRSPMLAHGFSPIRDATRKMAAPQIRNVATVGGNIASAVPCADLPPILTAMKASVVLWSPEGRREVPLHSFFIGARETVRRDDELLTEALVPLPQPGFGAAYARFGLRDGNTIAVAAVAAGLLLDGDDTIRDARIVLGAVAPVPKLVESAGAALVGQRPDEDAFRATAVTAMEAAEPISDVRGSADYRRELVGVLTERALTTACERARRSR
ncbi:MAG: xanthine dehydrogenase family protein subunit M [Phycisphaerales bacterium]|nr:MAG: xanthine dehydrogenase family protein subunit M [Phycisphaerales bacterium]